MVNTIYLFSFVETPRNNKCNNKFTWCFHKAEQAYFKMLVDCIALGMDSMAIQVKFQVMSYYYHYSSQSIAFSGQKGRCINWLVTASELYNYWNDYSR